MRCRIEKDKLGEKTIGQESYFGIGTERSKETFQMTKHTLSRQMIKALALAVKVTTKTNGKMGLLTSKETEVLLLSCDEILNGKLHGQFVVDVLHDGYGHGMYVNAIEVITNRANEMLGSKKGLYDLIPLDKVMKYHDLNEMVIFVGKLALVKIVKKLVAECKKTYNALYAFLDKTKADESSYAYNQILSIAEILEKDTKRIDKGTASILQVSYGKNVPDDIKDKYLKTFIECLNSEVTEKYTLPTNYLSQSNNLDCFVYISALVKNMMVNFSRSICNLSQLVDLNKLEIPTILSIDKSPQKVISSFVRQVSFYIVGNDMTVSRSVEEGELDDNAYLPIIYASLQESVNLVRRSIRTVKEKVFDQMTIKE